jgi:hypothetical protein
VQKERPYLQNKQSQKKGWGCGSSGSVKGAGSVCDQKTPKFFEQYWEDSMAGHMGVNGIY